jgi:uncharacterized protein with PQ loop repeat
MDFEEPRSGGQRSNEQNLRRWFGIIAIGLAFLPAVFAIQRLCDSKPVHIAMFALTIICCIISISGALLAVFQNPRAPRITRFCWRVSASALVLALLALSANLVRCYWRHIQQLT